MTTELVVFDLAGTTVHDRNDVHRVLIGALEKLEFKVSFDDVNNVMGIPKPVAIRALLSKHFTYPSEVPETLVDKIHQTFVSDMIEFYENDPFVEEKEGVSETFARLKQHKIKIFVDTGFDRLIAAPLLRRMRWEEKKLIDGSVTSDEVPKGRPHPDMIFRAMELSGTKLASRVAKVGDTTSDLEEGTVAGCGFVIGVTTGAHGRAKLETARHTHLVDHLEQLVPILV